MTNELDHIEARAMATLRDFYRLGQLAEEYHGAKAWVWASAAGTVLTFVAAVLPPSDWTSWLPVAAFTLACGLSVWRLRGIRGERQRITDGINGTGMFTMRPESAPGDTQGASPAPGDPEGYARPAEWRHRVAKEGGR